LGSDEEPIQPKQTQPDESMQHFLAGVGAVFAPGFEKALKQHKAERRARGFRLLGPVRSHAVLSAGAGPIAARDLRGWHGCQRGAVEAFGVPVAPKKSRLAYANEHRPWELYQTVFRADSVAMPGTGAQPRRREKFRFKNILMSLDGSIIERGSVMARFAQVRPAR
jgi:hypothetical protein